MRLVYVTRYMPRFRKDLLLKGIALISFTSLAAFSWATPSETRPTKPRRIVSLNLCSDQLLLELADRDQIAGLTRNADNPEMSAAAAKSRGLRLLGTSAEEILEINPDLIMGLSARRSGVVSALSAQDYRVLDLKSAESYEAIVAQIREVAEAVGHPARGEALIARMNAQLADIPVRPGHKVAAYYQRRGYMTGTGTLIDDLMKRVGLQNLASQLDKPALSQLSLEELIAAQPDYLIVESATDRITDQGTEMLHHPILAGVQRLRLPQAWTVCGGPAYVQAARSLSQQMAAPKSRAHVTATY